MMDACSKCPHQSDCLKIGSCLDEVNARYLAEHRNQFARLMTSVQAYASMEALRSGQAVRRFTNGGKELGPPIVSRKKFLNHCTAYPSYRVEAQQLAKANEAEAARIRNTVTLNRARKRFCELARAAERCSNGHVRTAENTFYARYGNDLVRRCKECRKAMLARAMPSIERMRAVFEEMHQGQTLTSVTGRGRNTKGIIIKYRVLMNFMEANPKAAKRLRALSEKNKLASMRQSGLERRTAAAPELLRNDGRDAYEAVWNATAHLHENDRDDVMTIMLIAVGEGRLKLSKVQASIGEFLDIHRRRPRVLGDPRYSLDNPVGEHSKITWLDTKTDADRLWG